MKKLIKVLMVIVIVNVIANAIARTIRAKKAEWGGLTESEVRDKLDAQLPGAMPAEKRGAVADSIVAGMRSRGMVAEDVATPGEDASDASDDEQDSDAAE